MSILIKGMEMPTTCRDCRLSTFTDFDSMPFCNITMDDICLNDWETKRCDNCPLIPVPDHGDLIDKSGVEVLSWTDGEYGTDFEDGVLFVLDKLDELPVIIPADGEDYEVPADGNLYDSLKRGLEQAINGESRSETVPADKEGEG